MLPKRCLHPIIVKEEDSPEMFQALLTSYLQSKKTFLKATDEVLRIMLENGLTQVSDRRAVWTHKKIFQNDLLISFTERVGESFPDDMFEKNCESFCQEKVDRNIKNKNHLTSHESRNPENSEWGGSAKLTFLLIDISGKTYEVECYGASSGLKEWEDLALELGPYHHRGVLNFEDWQVQDILRRVEESVKDDPSARPSNMTITEYVEMVFTHIDVYLKKLS